MGKKEIWDNLIFTGVYSDFAGILSLDQYQNFNNLLKTIGMETLIIEIQNPKARRLIDDLVDLGLISVKTSTKSSWIERWQNLSGSLPNVTEISEQDVLDEISEVRTKRLDS